MVGVCAQSGHDNIDMIEYFPTNGTFDLSYFPYYGKLAQVTTTTLSSLYGTNVVL